MKINIVFLSMIVALFFATGLLCAVDTVTTSSPWEHSDPELGQDPVIIPGSDPIVYPTTFTREREMFDYNPRFMPGKINFGKNNRPYIFTVVHPTNKYNGNQSATESYYKSEEAYIQTLDENGNWIVYDVSQMFKDFFGYAYVDPLIIGGLKHKHNVVFNDDGKSIYFGVDVSDRSSKTLIYSHNNLDTVNYTDIQGTGISTGMLEAFDTFLSTERYLPTICSNYRTSTAYEPVTLYELQEDPTGKIWATDPVVVSPDDFGDLAPLHSGTLNVTATVGETVHCVWFDNTSQKIEDHTDQYYTRYNRSTGEVSDPYYLGSTFGDWYGVNGDVPVDVHNGSVITVDRNKVLHVVLGAHHGQAKYVYSEDNGKSWSDPVDLPGGNSANTYPAVITDRDNTVHLVYRWSKDGRRLGYSRKKEGQSWEDMGALVIPYWWGHGQYHHNLTVDRLGRLFITYWYSATSSSGLPSDIQDEYDAKWPNQEDQLAHNPVIIMSDNGGDSWEIVTTQDFIDGFIDDTIPSAYYTLDSYGSQTDMTGNGHNLDTVSGQPGVVSGVSDNAASFDGIDDGYSGVFDQNDLLVDGAFTLTGWFKAGSVPSAKSNLVDGQNSSSGFGLYVENGKWTGYTYGDGISEHISSSSSVVADQWGHVALTYYPDGDANSTGTYTGTMKLYVDGSLETTLTGKEYSPSDANQIALGMSASGDGYFACGIDDLAIFKGAMPAEKISELANQEFSPFNVSRELLYKSDFNEDGKVNLDDAKNTFDSWLK